MEVSDLFKAIETGELQDFLGGLEEAPSLVNSISEAGLSVFEALLNAGYTNTAKTVIEYAEFEVNHIGHDPLRIAVALGYIDLASILLQAGASPNYRPEGMTSALLLCLENEYYDLAEEMVKQGAEVDIRNNQGWTPLIWASMKGRSKTVDFLLNHGANIHICNNDGWNAVTGAYFKKRNAIVNLLLGKGAVFGAKYAEAALLSAYDNGYGDVVTYLLDDMSINPNVADEKGISLLAKAVQKVDEPMVKKLCEKGADVNVFDEDGLPILATLATNGNDELIAVLIENGADVHLASKGGITAIYQATRNNKLETVKVLIQSGANVDAMESRGWTPLIAAASSGYLALVELLLELGANTELKTINESTAKDIALRNAPRTKTYNNLVDTAYSTIVKKLTLPGHLMDG